MPAAKPKTPHDIIEDMLARAQKAPYGLVAEVHEIDHAWAVEMRARNLNNRKISKANVRRYKADAASGKWFLNGQPIIFSADGVLADGQHRGEAVFETEFRVPTLVVAGVEPEARRTMDQGRSRTVADQMTIMGEDGEIAGTMIRYILAFDRLKGEALRGLAIPSQAEIIEFFEKHRDELLPSVQFARPLRDVARFHVAATMIAFLHYTLSKIDRDKAEQYLTQIAKGEGLNENDVAYRIREKLMALGRINATKKAEVLLTGWNAFYQGKPLRQIRVQAKIPDIGAQFRQLELV